MGEGGHLDTAVIHRRDTCDCSQGGEVERSEQIPVTGRRIEILVETNWERVVWRVGIKDDS